MTLKKYIEMYNEDHGSECYSAFGLDKEKLKNGGEYYMRYNKNDMELYIKYNVIEKILDTRRK